MRTPFVVALLVPVVLVQALSGCAPGKRPFLMVQICLADQRDVALFTDTMRGVAKSENMTFIDNSAQSREDLDAMGQAETQKRGSKPTIYIDVGNENGIGVGAGNHSLPAYQVALGFSEGSNPAEARRFADRVIHALAQRWSVETIPAGRGALPMKKCGS